MTTSTCIAPHAPAQRGAAALSVVLVLFFIVSLVAAYASRTMVFEQRTSANQYRATQAFELAEAGIEWGLAMLNSGLVQTTGTCAPDAAGVNTFRQRYMTFEPTTGIIEQIIGRAATCVRLVGGGWSCSCPNSAATTIPGGGGVSPGFRLRFELDADSGGKRPAAIRLTASACTIAGDACLALPQVPMAGAGNASVSALVGLKGAIATIPSAALTLPAADTASASLTLTGSAQVRAFNTQPGSSGIAIHAGGMLPASGLTVAGPAGMPTELAVLSSEMTLSTQAATGGLRNSSDAGACGAGATHPGCSANRMFTNVFGASRETYFNQPALVRCAPGCDAAALAVLAAKNPRSVLHVTGNVNLNGNLGSVANPVALVVDGDVTLAGAGTQITGFVYSTSGSWTVTGNPVVEGAVVAERALTVGGTGTIELRYSEPVLRTLRNEFGSFTRVPGGWRDWLI